MRCRIHRGCHEIGGNCVEVESHGKRIVLDIGLPLKDEGEVSVPDIGGLTSKDDSLLGVLISHPHPDHYGLLEEITEPVPIYMGEASRRIIDVSAFFTRLPTLGNLEPHVLSDQQTITLGPFSITPYRIDHSAYDSYCLLVEADSKRLFYSGDIRGHGRNAHLFDDLIRNPPRDIDDFICEGTQIGRDPDFAFPTEHSVADAMAEVFNETDGMCLVWCSSQNIDRLVSVWDACQRSRRQLILDMYTAEIIRAARDDALPKPGKEGVTVYLPFSQKQKIKREKAFHISNPYYPHRIYPDALAEAASGSVMVFRPSMLRDLQRAKCLNSASLISSVWSGYVHRNRKELDEMAALGIQRKQIHTSGHATVDELRQFVEAVPARRVFPIHLEDRDGFAELSDRVEIRNDHEWWEVQ
ncbi:MBL fold metallo-hydrolase [Thalassoroseus pseudoceratinae]|uniref:MBL fold metallo-hydrolase n=1 Tax=Thalassoroseus pseudoceratinae TaxID=2713176 RepID=UPI0014200509|nr:MBL fold metallo-hydrolase [Thalassoroseus pseudoceratinae]